MDIQGKKLVMVGAAGLSYEEAAEICGVPAADIAKAAEWIAKPHDDGSRRKDYRNAKATTTRSEAKATRYIRGAASKHICHELAAIPRPTRNGACPGGVTAAGVE